MMTDETMAHLKDIDDMLENRLVEEEDTAVEAMLLGGYGHDDSDDAETSPRQLSDVSSDSDGNSD